MRSEEKHRVAKLNNIKFLYDSLTDFSLHFTVLDLLSRMYTIGIAESHKAQNFVFQPSTHFHIIYCWPTKKEIDFHVVYLKID